MILIQSGCGSTMAINPDHIETVIEGKDEFANINLLNKDSWNTIIKYGKIKTILSSKFIEVSVPKRENPKLINFRMMLNCSMISVIAYENVVFPHLHPQKELLIYDSNVPKFDRWSEDNNKMNNVFVCVIMCSGISYPVDCGVVELCSNMERAKRSVMIDKTKPKIKEVIT